MGLLVNNAMRLAAVLLGLTGANWAAAAPDTLRIGTEGAYPPFEYRDA